MTLREMIDTAQGLLTGRPAPKTTFSVRDQVVLRRPVGFSGQTNELLTGEIISIQDKDATVSFSRPGGTASRTTVKLNQLEPVRKVLSRFRVHSNPFFRGQM